MKVPVANQQKGFVMESSNQTPDWVGPVLWGSTAGFLIVGILLVGYVILKNERAQSTQRKSGSLNSQAARTPHADRNQPDPDAASSQLVGAPTDPDDLALLRLLKGAHFGESGRIVLPSGRSITSQQARELTQDS